MNSKDLEKKLNKLSKKVIKLNDKAEKKKETTKKEITTSLNKAKSEMEGFENTVRNNLDFAVEQDTSKVVSSLLKQKMIVEAKKDEIRKKIDKKKFENAKEKAAYELECQQEYAAYAIELALLMVDEAEIAMLEAIEAEKEYEETYK